MTTKIRLKKQIAHFCALLRVKALLPVFVAEAQYLIRLEKQHPEGGITLAVDEEREAI